MRQYKKGARVLKGVAFTLKEANHIRESAGSRGCSQTQVIRDAVRYWLDMENRESIGGREHMVAEMLGVASEESWRADSIERLAAMAVPNAGAGHEMIETGDRGREAVAGTEEGGSPTSNDPGPGRQGAEKGKGGQGRKKKPGSGR